MPVHRVSTESASRSLDRSAYRGSRRGAPPSSRLLPQRAEHDRIDPLGAVDALLEVLGAGPVEEGLTELAVVAEPRETLTELAAQDLVDLQPLLARRHAEDLLVQRVQPFQRGDRLGMIVDAQIDECVRQASVTGVLLDHEQRRRLLTAAVAARSLRGSQTADQ